MPLLVFARNRQVRDPGFARVRVRGVCLGDRGMIHFQGPKSLAGFCDRVFGRGRNQHVADDTHRGLFLAPGVCAAASERGHDDDGRVGSVGDVMHAGKKCIRGRCGGRAGGHHHGRRREPDRDLDGTLNKYRHRKDGETKASTGHGDAPRRSRRSSRGIRRSRPAATRSRRATGRSARPARPRRYLTGSPPQARTRCRDGRHASPRGSDVVTRSALRQTTMQAA